MESKITALGAILVLILALSVAFGFTLFLGWLVMICWNYAVVALFSAPEVSFWQAYALWGLLVIITGGVRYSASRSD